MITLVAAMSNNAVIGAKGTMPWAGKLRGDMEHFVRYTASKTVVMGRKTYDSIPSKFKPLEGRSNVIVTRDRSYSQPGCEIVHDEFQIVALSHKVSELVVIGGAEIYKLLMPRADKLVITHVHGNIPGDTFFPTMLGHWNAHTILRHDRDNRNAYPFSIVEYIRV